MGGGGKRLPIVFRPSPKEINGKSAQLLLLFIIMNIKRFEQHFASIYRLLEPGGVRGKKIPDLHKVEFCPELKISKIGHQNSSIFWHVAQLFWVVFRESIIVLVRYQDAKNGVIRVKGRAFLS